MSKTEERLRKRIKHLEAMLAMKTGFANDLYKENNFYKRELGRIYGNLRQLVGFGKLSDQVLKGVKAGFSESSYKDAERDRGQVVKVGKKYYGGFKRGKK